MTALLSNPRLLAKICSAADALDIEPDGSWRRLNRDISRNPGYRAAIFIESVPTGRATRVTAGMINNLGSGDVGFGNTGIQNIGILSSGTLTSGIAHTGTHSPGGFNKGDGHSGFFHQS